jgi:exonuclease III
MEWNANGLLQHQNELQVILSTENIDICLISETHFTKGSFIRFKNYITYHTIHPAYTARGGSAVIIRNNIKHFEEKMYVICDIQGAIVTVGTSKQKLIVSAIYCLPRYSIYANEFKTLFDKMNRPFFIGGDFNAKHIHWGSRLITPKVVSYTSLLQTLDVRSSLLANQRIGPQIKKKLPDLIYFSVVKIFQHTILKI